MKILYLIQKKQLRGVEISISQLSRHLASLGHEVRVLSLRDGEADLSVPGVLTPLQVNLSNRFLDWRGWKSLNREIRSFRPDIVQANSGDTLKYAVFSKSVFRWPAPLVYRSGNRVSYFVTSRPVLYLNRYLTGRVDRVVSVSDICRRDFIETLRYPEERIVTIPRGIELREIGGVPHDLARLLDSWPILLNVASLVPEKNHIGLFRIFSNVLSRYPSARLVVVGTGPLEKELRSAARALDIEPGVHFLGQRTDVLEIMKACHAFVLTSHVEGLPGVVLEAMYCRVPVVSYDVGGVGEALDESTGRLIAPGDEAAMMRAIVSTLEDKEVSEARAGAAHELIVSRFDNRRISALYADLYGDIVRAGHARESAR